MTPAAALCLTLPLIALAGLGAYLYAYMQRTP